MSATNRGAARAPRDLYETPSWCVHRLLDAIGHRLPWPETPGALDHENQTMWIEPAAGGCAIPRAVNEWVRSNGYPTIAGHDWLGVDIEPLSQAIPMVQMPFAEWLANWKKESRNEFALAITNPPYTLALEYAKGCTEIADVTALLLRLNWIGSGERREGRITWLREHAPDIYALPNRPSFTGGGSDATEYAWFVWGLSDGGRFEILPLTSDADRKASKAAR